VIGGRVVVVVVLVDEVGNHLFGGHDTARGVLRRGRRARNAVAAAIVWPRRFRTGLGRRRLGQLDQPRRTGRVGRLVPDDRNLAGELGDGDGVGIGTAAMAPAAAGDRRRPDVSVARQQLGHRDRPGAAGLL
jgi:hypothetical protein